MGLTEEQTAALKKLFQWYFSDPNIMVDNFLLKLVKENEKGFVPIATLCTFNKVKAISVDGDEIAKAIEGTEGLELSEDRKSVRRTAPLPEKWEPVPRSIYAKGVPENETHERLTEFFSQYGKVFRVTKRTFKGGSDGKKFKPSVYVEYSSVEEAKKAIEAKPEYNGTKLEVMMREEHEKEIASLRTAAGKGKPEKRKREEEDADDEAEVPVVELPKDASLRFTGVAPLGEDYKIVKTAVTAIAPVKFCVMREGVATLMLDSKEGVEKVVAKNKESPIAFGETKPEALEVLEGEAEEAFRKEMTEKLVELKKRQKKNPGGKKGGKGKKGGRKGYKGSK